MIVPPNNEEAEMAVIGSILIEPGVLQEMREILDPGRFYFLDCGRIFGALCKMSDDRIPIDTITVKHYLGNEVDIKRLMDCNEKVQNCSHSGYYSKIVASLHFEREIIKACHVLAASQDNNKTDEIRELVLKKESLTIPSLFNYKKDLVDILDKIINPEKQTSIQTYIRVIDEAWMGTKPGEINTWCAATNVGKSLVLLNLMNLAAINGHKCLYVGTEMDALETVQRHISIVSAVSPWKIRSAKLDLEELSRINNACSQRLSEMPISILDIPEPSLNDIDNAISASKADIIFLDYLERFQLPKEESLRLRIREFMRKLKTLARQRGVIVHLASQLNRNAYGKEEVRPTMAEISEASAVEKESDRVMIIWTPKAKQTFPNGKVMEIIQAKNRHGRRGLVFDLFMNENNLQITEVNNYVSA